nr:unnamed protein product [Digitaria exilis]
MDAIACLQAQQKAPISTKQRRPRTEVRSWQLQHGRRCSDFHAIPARRGKRELPAPRRSAVLLPRLASCPCFSGREGERGRPEKAKDGVVTAAAANRG